MRMLPTDIDVPRLSDRLEVPVRAEDIVFDKNGPTEKYGLLSKIAMPFQIMGRGSTKILSHNTGQLNDQEPEGDSSILCLRCFKLTFWALIGTLLVYFVVLQSIAKYGLIKS